MSHLFLVVESFNCMKSCGSNIMINLLQEATHGDQFRGDLKRNLERNVGFDAVMRLRCSTGDETFKYIC